MYFLISRLASWMLLLARSDTAKDVETLVLRPQLAALHRLNPRPRMSGADQAWIAALVGRAVQVTDHGGEDWLGPQVLWLDGGLRARP